MAQMERKPLIYEASFLVLQSQLNTNINLTLNLNLNATLGYKGELPSSGGYPDKNALNVTNCKNV